MVMFNAIPAECLAEMLTEERVQKLRDYVRDGGHLLLDCNSPERLGDLLPVTFTGPEQRSPAIAERPRLDKFKALPEQWQQMTKYRPALAKDEAVVHCMLTKNNDFAWNSVGIASLAYGKGQVWFYNGEWVMHASDVRSFCHWAYCNAFMTALVSEAMGVELNVAKHIPSAKSYREPAALGEMSLQIAELKNSLEKRGTVSLTDESAQFSNGCAVRLKQDGDIEVHYPGVPTSVALNLPRPQLSDAPQALNGDNNEAIVKSYNLTNSKISWKRLSSAVEDNRLVVKYGAEGAKLTWEFLPVTVQLDGREYVGYGERVVMEELPILQESLVLSSRVPMGKLRRLTCYTNPRGYLEGEVRQGGILDSRIWQFFCSGQPFTYAAIPQGIMVDFVDTPIPCFAQFTARAEGDKRMNRSLRLLAGRKKAPVAFPIIWHLFTPGAENGNNDYIGVYQFVRQHLRDKCGIKSFPQLTQAAFYHHGRSDEELEQSAKAAAELNFKSVWLSLCPLPLESIPGNKLASVMQIVDKHGLIPHAWTAGGYGHGDNQPVFKQHPEWFIREQDGTFYKYFKLINVADFNVADFREWYLKLIDGAQANGMKRIYMDMGGQISSNVNYYPPEAGPNLDGLVRIFQSLSARGLPFSVEGMNPLAKDQALFRPEKSYPMEGKEFAYVGGCPLASVDDGISSALHMNYFCLAMYNASINIDVDGYVMNFERIPGELKAVQRIGELNRTINRANEHVPTPFVRETAFGTAWVGDDTGALFFYHPVKKLKLQLPPDWVLMGEEPLENIPAYSVRLLKRVKP